MYVINKVKIVVLARNNTLLIVPPELQVCKFYINIDTFHFSVMSLIIVKLHVELF